MGFLNAEKINYESAEYRWLVDGEVSAEHFYKLHDGEQLAKLGVLGTADLRGRTIIDIGCAAGPFLDLVKGFAAETIGVEPMEQYHCELRRKGHRVFNDCSQALNELRSRIDLAVCFSVIEHVEDPVQLLREIKQLLSPQGRLLISTPNSADWLLELLPVEYGRFFYRMVHRWYFNRQSLECLAQNSGYANSSMFYVHRFDLSNALLWLRDKRPTGLGGLPVWPPLDAAFRTTLETEGRADYVYAWLSPGGDAKRSCGG